MRIRDITLSDVANGRNWRLTGQGNDRLEQPMEEWPIEPAPVLQGDDLAVYSAVYVLEDGTVEPRLIVKEVASPEYSGDCCEFVGGKWRQVGLVPDPAAPFGTEWVANPDPADPSFVEAYDHAEQARNFVLHVTRMRRS